LAILLLIYGASRMDLRFASAVFATCLLVSAAVLVYALVFVDGVGLYLQAVPTFTADLSTFSPSRVVAISLAVGLLVCTGADYQQFVLAARTPGSALRGCLLAGLLVFFIGFLPSAVVVAMQNAGALAGLANTKQVVPWVLGQVAGSVGQGADKLMLVALSLAALGACAAILRAMTEALACSARGKRTASHPVFALIALGASALLASRDQGIVNTMVSVNVVYIASIGVCFVTMVTGIVVPPLHARWIMDGVCCFCGGVPGGLAWRPWPRRRRDLTGTRVPLVRCHGLVAPHGGRGMVWPFLRPEAMTYRTGRKAPGCAGPL
jgi:SSS family solute:Na+ symporter